MQNTRLNDLVGNTVRQLGRWFFNPWQRLSLLVIGFLFGFFLGGTTSLVAGQAGEWDIIAAAIVLALTEVVDRIYYSQARRAERPLWAEGLNSVKIGVTYSLFVEAFKLGS